MEQNNEQVIMETDKIKIIMQCCRCKKLIDVSLKNGVPLDSICNYCHKTENYMHPVGIKILTKRKKRKEK